MEIVQVRVHALTTLVPMSGKDQTFVLRVTSDAGIDGWADGVACAQTLQAAAAVGKRLFGLDPRALGHVGSILSSVEESALSIVVALEVACWDLASKAAGVPLALLLGGVPEGAVRLDRSAAPLSLLKGLGVSHPLARLSRLLVGAPAEDSANAVTLDLSDFRGIGAMRRACDLCAAWGRPVILRQDVPGDLIALGLAHLGASASSELSVSLHLDTLRTNLAGADLRVSSEGIFVPDGPGLGIWLDERVIGAPILFLQHS